MVLPHLQDAPPGQQEARPLAPPRGARRAPQALLVHQVGLARMLGSKVFAFSGFWVFPARFRLRFLSCSLSASRTPGGSFWELNLVVFNDWMFLFVPTGDRDCARVSRCVVCWWAFCQFCTSSAFVHLLGRPVLFQVILLRSPGSSSSMLFLHLLAWQQFLSRLTEPHTETFIVSIERQMAQSVLSRLSFVARSTY